jgi:hypothetical protein
MAASYDLVPAVTIAQMQDNIREGIEYCQYMRDNGIDPNERNKLQIYLSSPGTGKTFGGKQVAHEMLQPDEWDMTRDGNFSLVDYIGVPETVINEVTGKPMTQFATMDIGHQQALGTSKMKFVIHDEVSEAYESVQNLLCGVVYDAQMGTFELDPYIFRVALGNFSTDKAGSKELISKLLNRSEVYVIQPDTDGLIAHMLTVPEFDRDVVAYLHWKGQDAIYGKEGFDPKQAINNTPRQWSGVARMNKPDITDRKSLHRFSLRASSMVRKGEVAELVAFLKLVKDPSFIPIDQIIKDPTNAPVSDKIDVCYALGSRLLTEIKNASHFEHAMKYVSRMRPEPQTWFVNAAVKHHPEVQGTRAYLQWARNNKAYFTGR